MTKIPLEWAHYWKRRIKEGFMEKVREYNEAPHHCGYSKPCRHCGKTFVGSDWRFAETDYCSETCQLADYGKKIAPQIKFEIKLFWKYFGKDIRLLEGL